MAEAGEPDLGRGTTARRVVVHGRVQGVFYRDSCRQEAERLGVAGWVVNEPDGTVRVHAEGAPDAVRSLVEWCRTGPTRAVVHGVEVTDTNAEGLGSFEVR
ncbi:acylphosphatase [Nocardioides sp. HDW12B]|uniref:acylphosphatase n=1 Tax=Nocardioides sp. HDW12B TaxID=2714939 RepID=UPI00140E27CD|nr:acylphosphatase [Nocardioides sp. HDW12B]QIK65246.1 acylphosphatase [Nocardioides sp. HDW12B]